MAEDMIERLAMVLAWQRRLDMGDDERFHDDGTREGYWRSLTDQTRELMRLRAQSALGIALDPEDEALLDVGGEALIDEFQRMMREEGGWNSGGLMRVILTALRTHALSRACGPEDK